MTDTQSSNQNLTEGTRVRYFQIHGCRTEEWFGTIKAGGYGPLVRVQPDNAVAPVLVYPEYLIPVA